MIVVGIDGSAGSAAALAFAADEADIRGTDLRVVTAWHVPSGMYAGGFVPTVESLDYGSWQREMAERQMHDVLGPERAERTELVVIEGSPAAVLRSESERAELLVVGSRGHGGFTGLLRGSVSNQCAAHARCPVVIVRAQ
jgi:nucleotide-binding universal stress UspA family protein